MKKYISPRIEEIKMTADVIATSFGSTNDTPGFSEEGYEGGYAPSRYGRYREDYELF